MKQQFVHTGIHARTTILRGQTPTSASPGNDGCVSAPTNIFHCPLHITNPLSPSHCPSLLTREMALAVSEIMPGNLQWHSPVHLSTLLY